MKIYAPVKDTNGVRASVRFVNGVGETDNPLLISWFKKHGYEVVDDTPETVEDAIGKIIDDTEFVDINKLADEAIDTVEMYETLPDGTPNFDAMTPNELRDWAKANGKGLLIGNLRNKQKLIEILKG